MLLRELREADCVRMSVDQNANHVVQKVIFDYIYKF